MRTPTSERVLQRARDIAAQHAAGLVVEDMMLGWSRTILALNRAHSLLDQARRGDDVPVRQITQALRLTGDIR